MHPKVDDFIEKAQNWQQAYEQLRRIVLDCQLTEEFKWRQPCYSYQGKNIAIIGGFKDYCALMFFKGSLLKDTEDILESPGENTQSGRLIRFTKVQEIVEMEATLKAYIFEAVEVEKAGLKVKLKKTSDYEIPEELQKKFDIDASFKAAFEDLTPGRQKGYLLYFSAAKQAKTRASRIESYTPRILDGKGFHDCVCGLSKKYPTCDGSHKILDEK
ncbi:MAG: DUF1801 domain-containing protein [Flavobacteriaceae bacterium]